jgi:PadR family transcriptional regulator, regulatory protein AphA
MSIKYAILGLLSWKPLTGYDLKKIIEDSAVMYWSGNNNQIYKALVDLHSEGLVTTEVVHRESAPSKKIYTITETGSAGLREWVLSDPEAPEMKKVFLVQLAWSDPLDSDELSGLLDRYENEVKMQSAILKEKNRRRCDYPDRNQREVLIWSMISENAESSLENELRWIRKFREQLRKMI